MNVLFSIKSVSQDISHKKKTREAPKGWLWSMIICQPVLDMEINCMLGLGVQCRFPR
mgnify:FL=1